MESYILMNKQLVAMLDSEKNIISNLSNASALLNETLDDINWVGFYLYCEKENALKLGPFQGKVACTHIPINKGVCGTAAYLKETILVEDVHKFEGHIACDAASNSEIVIPIIISDNVFGVLDVDSPVFSRFTQVDKKYLEEFVNIVKGAIINGI